MPSLHSPRSSAPAGRQTRGTNGNARPFRPQQRRACAAAEEMNALRRLLVATILAVALAGCQATRSLPAATGDAVAGDARPGHPTDFPTLPPPPPGTTMLAQIPNPVPTAPNHDVPPFQGNCVGCPDAPGAYYDYPPAPSAGYDAIEFAMSPQTFQGTVKTADYFWAYEDYFQDGNTFYFGLQPGGQYGKTALFSIFGRGTKSEPSYTYCFKSADGGAGTSCHIPYAWLLHHFYDFTVTLVGQNETSRTWEGRVYDDNAKKSTLIGDITVKSLSGIDGGDNEGNFDEYYSGCRPSGSFSEILFLAPVPYYQGSPYPGHTTKTNLEANTACGSSAYYSDDRSYMYLDQGNM
jgi:hypothetical protein